MNDLIEILLTDRTTGNHIVWANAEHGATEIKSSDVDEIQPRHEKNRAQQKRRTRERAEIFTPPEVCKLQNDTIDNAWLRDIVEPWLQKNYYGSNDLLVDTLTEKISDAWFRRNKISSSPEQPEDTFVANFLNEHKTLWHAYVDARRLEITCGEAPYLVNRYNAVTGTSINLAERVGLLDRKLRVVNAETKTLPDWLEFATRAVKSVYGYELQGDNLFLARRNVFDTVVEYFTAKFPCKPPEDFLRDVAEIISWNLWQMDGLNFAVPHSKPQRVCRIKDWSTGEQIMFFELAHGA